MYERQKRRLKGQAYDELINLLLDLKIKATNRDPDRRFETLQSSESRST